MKPKNRGYVSRKEAWLAYVLVVVACVVGVVAWLW